MLFLRVFYCVDIVVQAVSDLPTLLSEVFVVSQLMPGVEFSHCVQHGLLWLERISRGVPRSGGHDIYVLHNSFPFLKSV